MRRNDGDVSQAALRHRAGSRAYLEVQGAALVRKLGGVWHDGQGACLCPAHDDHNPSLSVQVGQRALLFKCFAGCETLDVIRAIRHLHLPLVEPFGASEWISARPRYIGPGPAIRVWNQSVLIAGSPAAAYLAARCLLPSWQDLRYNPRTPLGRKEAAVFRPALIAAIREGCELKAIHRTFLDPGTATKAGDLADPRMMLGRPGRGCVQLAPAKYVLGLTEGIETAIAAMCLHHIPVWATLGTERAHRILLPDHLKRLILLFDRDKAGWLAERRARSAYTRPGLEILTFWPPRGYGDWAEVLEARAAKAA